ncbi:hypothetical protein T10_784 [Trichinella papuae]|uniref:Uncharacterized protein n=1 Tax=Trichinella papuae TaxID=268474 RepID=A0A0V1N9R4_9BILA|nr:hypothetical protein T10_784 [Trichinella papuae]
MKFIRCKEKQYAKFYTRNKDRIAEFMLTCTLNNNEAMLLGKKPKTKNLKLANDKIINICLTKESSAI